MTKQKGSFLLNWSSACLQAPGLGNLPVMIDKTSFMPILICFHDVDKSMKHLANPCVTDEINPMLSAKSKLLLKLHYKLDFADSMGLISSVTHGFAKCFMDLSTS